VTTLVTQTVVSTGSTPDSDSVVLCIDLVAAWNKTLALEHVVY